MAKPWPIPDLDPAGPLAANARAITAVRVGELLSYDAVFPDAEAVLALHDSRIAGKRLRYTLELLAGCFGDDGAIVLAEVKALQEDLGIVHDRDVLIATIEGRLHALGADQGDAATPLRESLESLLGRIREERAAQHHAVAMRWARLMEAGFRDRLVRLAGDNPIPTTPA